MAVSLFEACEKLVKWIESHKLVKEKFHGLQRKYIVNNYKALHDMYRHYEGKCGALRKHCVTRWWSVVEVMCRLLRWQQAVQGICVRLLAKLLILCIIALLAAPATDFMANNAKKIDSAIEQLLADKPTFKSWQWEGLSLVCQVIGPIRALIKLLVCSVFESHC